MARSCSSRSSAFIQSSCFSDFLRFCLGVLRGDPEYKQNDFFLTAESYGGIYILREIMNRGGVDTLKGAAIGDGCWGTKI